MPRQYVMPPKPVRKPTVDSSKERNKSRGTSRSKSKARTAVASGRTPRTSAMHQKRKYSICSSSASRSRNGSLEETRSRRPKIRSKRSESSLSDDSIDDLSRGHTLSSFYQPADHFRKSHLRQKKTGTSSSGNVSITNSFVARAAATSNRSSKVNTSRQHVKVTPS